MPGSSEAKVNYFHKSVNFFHEYRWIYDFKATHILTDSVTQNVPQVLKEYFQSLDEAKFRDILVLADQDDWPSGISKFIKECIHLKNLAKELANGSTGVEFLPSETSNSSKLKLPKKWNPKKYFEVVHVGNFVGEKCKLENCDAVIDIGSGLGYLSRHIASEFEIPVIGLESDSARVSTATRELDCNTPSASSTLQTFVCLRITENISKQIGPLVESYRKVCVTALHACGDLSPWALKHFITTDTCKMVAVVPCCYHKMSSDASNFPMSFPLKSALCKYKDANFLKNQWLWRLASQRSGDRFLDDIKKETKNMFYRAILEKICIEENLLLQRRKRNLHDNKFDTFEEYMEKTLGLNGGFHLLRCGCKISDEELANIKQRMLLQHELLIPWSPIITGILAMQGAIQKIAEDLILIDRLVYLEESDIIKESGLIKVIPDNVSPRGMVLFAVKK